MGSDELNKFRLDKSDKILTLIAFGYGLFLAYNMWADRAISIITNLISNIL